MITIPPFKTLKVQDPVMDRVQANIELVLSPLGNIPLLSGILLPDIVLGSSETAVKHKLGRAPRGWLIVDKNAQQDVWRTNATTLPTQFLNLTAAGTVTVTLWVF